MTPVLQVVRRVTQRILLNQAGPKTELADGGVATLDDATGMRFKLV